MIHQRPLLTAILALQLLILAAVIFWDAGDAEENSETLLTVAVDTVDRVRISAGDDEVTLRNTDAGWRVGDDVPADADKLIEVLNDLVELRLGWPVATSVDTQDRFEVAADNYQRHVEVFVADALVGDFYLGSSPGYRRVHARLASADEIFSVDFATFELPADVAGWLDKSLLAIGEEITQIERPGQWRLSKTTGVIAADADADADADEHWTLADLTGTGVREVSQDAARDLAERLRNLRVSGVAEAGAVAGEPALLIVASDAGTSELSLWHDAEQDEYVIASTTVPGQFTLASYAAEQLLVAGDDLAAVELPSDG